MQFEWGFLSRAQIRFAALLQPGEDSLGVFKELGFIVVCHAEARREKHSIFNVVYAELSFCLGEARPFLLRFCREVRVNRHSDIAQGDVASFMGEPENCVPVLIIQ